MSVHVFALAPHGGDCEKLADSLSFQTETPRATLIADGDFTITGWRSEFETISALDEGLPAVSAHLNTDPSDADWYLPVDIECHLHLGLCGALGSGKYDAYAAVIFPFVKADGEALPHPSIPRLRNGLVGMSVAYNGKFWRGAGLEFEKADDEIIRALRVVVAQGGTVAFDRRHSVWSTR